MQVALTDAIAHGLNDREREFLTLDTWLETPAADLMASFDIDSRVGLKRVRDRLYTLIRDFVTYFVSVDHHAAVARAKRLVGDDANICLDVFAGMAPADVIDKYGLHGQSLREKLKVATATLIDRGDANVQEFARMVRRANQIKRLQ